MILLSGTFLIKLKINTGGPRPLSSAPDDLFEKFPAPGYVAPDDMKEMKERASALGVPLTGKALLMDRPRPGARGWILPESLAQSVEEMPRRGMVPYGDVAPFFR